MPLTEDHIAVLSLPPVGGKAGFVALLVAQKSSGAVYDVLHLDAIKTTRADFADVLKAITPMMRSATLWGETAFLIEASAAAKPQLRHAVEVKDRLVAPGCPFSFLALNAGERRPGDFGGFARRDAYATSAVVASSGRLRIAKDLPHADVLAAELAALRATTNRRGATDWEERGAGKDVLLPAVATAIMFGELCITQEGGRLVAV
jgi:hypothetical protein